MEFLSEFGMFLAKTLTFTAAIVFIIIVAVAAAAKNRKEPKGSIVVTHLNKEIEDYSEELRNVVEDEEQLKQVKKAEKKAKKLALKQKKQAGEEAKKRYYVLDFHGDPRASQVENLRRAITAVLSVIRDDGDEIILRLESPGGMVHAYGLAASQLARIRKANIPLTVCVDKVAASGGYMMACIGTRIIAAPFAYIGSIGVLLQLPNFNRLLRDKHVDFEMITAGEYKRTLTLFGENTDKGREKVTEEIQETHDLFKAFVKEYRPALNIDQVATGETWFGRKALELNLIDDIRTSDEVIAEACRDAEVYSVVYEKKKNLSERFSKSVENALDNSLLKWLNHSSRDHIG